MYTVFTNGCFDVLHRGHLELLQRCSLIRNTRAHTVVRNVIVGLNSDASVRRLKGSSRPINCQYDRKYHLESLKYVDRVIIFDEDSPRKLIEQIKPDLIVKSGVVIPEEVEGYKVQLFDHVNGYSTTNTINEISSNRR